MKEAEGEPVESLLQKIQELESTQQTELLKQCMQVMRTEFHNAARAIDEYDAVFLKQTPVPARVAETISENILPQGHIPRTISFSPSKAIATEARAPMQSDNGTVTAIRHLGPYELIRVIGEGGMGTVYLAEQRAPIQRTVAIKMARIAINSPELQQRFELERQTLAMMNHECIAKLLEAGQTPDARPFFIMEYVEGKPVTVICDEAGAALQDRLDIFLMICDAIQHAHQRGILHRDIKPGNILATAAGDVKKVKVKVIDFGLAKLTDAASASAPFQTGTDNDAHQTVAGQVMGTLSYMSPEQAGGNPADVDTRTDVYSLGALLFELLTGTTPFETQELNALSFQEMIAKVRAMPVPLMSVRLSTLNEASLSSLKLSHASAISKAKLLTGDLDLIVARATHKDPGKRYQSVQAFADDLRRFLGHVPIEARQPSFWYVSSRFVRRNRRPVTVAASLILAAVFGLGSLLIKMNSDREAAESQAKLSRAASAQKLAETTAELESQKKVAAEASLKSSERDRIILQLAGSGNPDAPSQERIDAITNALQLNVMDDAGRCELQLAQIDLLYSMQRFDKVRELVSTIRPETLKQRAMLHFWQARMSPDRSGERSAAQTILGSDESESLAEREKLFLQAMMSESRSDAVPILQQLLQKFPMYVDGRKLLMACLLFEGRYDETLDEVRLLRILQADDPETEIAAALVYSLQGSDDALAQQLERLRTLLPERDMKQITAVFEQLTQTPQLIATWDSNETPYVQLARSALVLSEILDGFSKEQSVLDSSLTTLSTGLRFSESEESSKSTVSLSLQFGARFAVVTVAVALKNLRPFRVLIDDLAAASPIEKDALFAFIKGVSFLYEDNYPEAVTEFQKADAAPCMFQRLKPEILYCLSMSWAAIHVNKNDPESLKNAGDVAVRWLKASTDLPNGRLSLMLGNLRAAGRFDAALEALDRAQQQVPENQLQWDEMRLSILNAAQRDLDAFHLSRKLLEMPQLTDQQRAAVTAVQKTSVERLSEIIRQFESVE